VWSRVGEQIKGLRRSSGVGSQGPTLFLPAEGGHPP
jgi:hypothetical protein